MIGVDLRYDFCFSTDERRILLGGEISGWTMNKFAEMKAIDIASTPGNRICILRHDLDCSKKYVSEFSRALCFLTSSLIMSVSTDVQSSVC